ncbi:MAG: hypothetical protein US30_C0012G0050 [Candidatus Moranbacteria bacterium GW2011_GWF2_36_839]|nr:MAG: hypothetical protein US27_C0012G0024 [Candidatus Moranbacteria bacterium GW2011_GWF1_36_78]KKQ16740.1 MAG: hypothetical protein US30_C0012G0050 [Candidatus Moranbacteria bacterium GW2011_GWF2_36_839]HAT74253.1 hypothetical protein [Candidatus Moranbacteria bacterium]HBY11379.1 hypothetical protein [Candidatus Moranbacteria bacterium]
MLSRYIKYKNKAIELRNNGNTYGEIISKLNVKIPKSTLSVWFSNIELSKEAKKRRDDIIKTKTKISHINAIRVIKEKREIYLEEVAGRVVHLKNLKNNKDIAKIILAILYLGEGGKTRKSSIMLGNSDPKVIKLFLDLLRKCYEIDEKKFRCTLQCRADQDIFKLEKFWSEVTSISSNQFYKARIDARTIGKKSKKPEYKGVCRIDYFSADIYNEIKKIIELICV